MFAALSDRVLATQRVSRTTQLARGDEVVDVVFDDYPEVTRWRGAASPQKRPWQLWELRALRDALALYERILGDARSATSRRGVRQEVATFGRLSKNYEATRNRDDPLRGEVGPEDETGGITYSRFRHVTLFDRDAVSNADLIGPAKSFAAATAERRYHTTVYTAAHELAHGLLDYALADFTKRFGWYRSGDVWTRTPPGEAEQARWLQRYSVEPDAPEFESPYSGYANESPGEDLAETAAAFFLEPDELQRCPWRAEFMASLVSAWTAGS